jgi:hypothetical protein
LPLLPPFTTTLLSAGNCQDPHFATTFQFATQLPCCAHSDAKETLPEIKNHAGYSGRVFSPLLVFVQLNTCAGITNNPPG